ncbi:MAG: hypothetical protein ACQERK_07505 [Campylobacterota bacterium]
MSLVFISQQKQLFYCQDYVCEPLEGKIKRHSVVGVVDPRKVITHSFKVPESITKDELDIEVEMKLYDEAGLNAADDYKFSYIVKDQNIEETENMVEAFAIKQNDLIEDFGPVAEKTKHIDTLTVPYVAYEGLYETHELEPQNDVFVHLGKEYSFVSLCKAGRYIYSRNISSLERLASNLDNDLGVDVDKFIELLHTKGLSQSYYDEEEDELFESVQTQMQNVYNRINDAVMYTRNIFSFESADRIFIECEGAWIRGIDTFINELLFDKAHVLSTREVIKVHHSSLTMDLTDCVVAWYATLHHSVLPNLSIFERKVPFARSFLAKCLYATAAGAAVASIYPLVLHYQNIQLREQIGQQQQVLQTKQKQQQALSADVNSLQKQIEKVQQKVDEFSAAKKTFADEVEQVLHMDRANRKDIKFVSDLDQLLQKIGLHASAVAKTDDGYEVAVYADYDSREKVTVLMREFLALGYESVKTDRIYHERPLYHSRVKIVL